MPMVSGTCNFRSNGILKSAKSKEVSNDKELEEIRTQILPLKTKTENKQKYKYKMQREHTVNRASSSFPKGGHLDIKTDIKNRQQETKVVPQWTVIR